MVDELEAGKTYKLINKKGYFAVCGDNYDYYLKYFKDDQVVLDRTGFTSGWVGEDEVISLQEYEFFELIESLVEKCVKHFEGKWPYEYYDRYVYLDEQGFWGLQQSSEQRVYYADFERCAVRLGYVEKREDCYAKTEKIQTKRYWDGKEPLEVGMIVRTWNNIEQEIVYILEKTVCLKSLEETSVLQVLFIQEIEACLLSPKEKFCKEVLNDIQKSHPDFANSTMFDIQTVAQVCWDKLRGTKDE